VLTYMLFVALTNLAMGIVLGYFYGPMFTPPKADPASPEHAEHAPAQRATPAPPPAATESAVSAPGEAVPSVASAATAVAEAPDETASGAIPANAEDLRPVKQTASREVSALDLADVMSELGLEQQAAAPVAS